MRKYLRYPRTLDEVKTRVRRGLEGLEKSRGEFTDDWFDEHVAYHVRRGPRFFTPEMVKGVNLELTRKRHKLSDRVAQTFRRTGRISLVCDLLRHSPVFLRDRWIPDLLLNLKCSAMTGTSLAVRRQALGDLRDLCEAIFSVRAPAGRGGRKGRGERLSVRIRRTGVAQLLAQETRYAHYLEIATCLKQVRSLTSDIWNKLRSEATMDTVILGYATELNVPAGWLRDCWRASTNPRSWAIVRLASDSQMTVGATRRQLDEASLCSKESRAMLLRMLDASDRLAPDRRRKMEERAHKTGFGYMRRY